MLFLLRSTFWLGLVFANISGLNIPGLPAAQDLADPVIRAAGQTCLKQPDECMKELERARRIAGMAATARGQADRSAKSGIKQASGTTLRATDIEPKWRGKTAMSP